MNVIGDTDHEGFDYEALKKTAKYVKTVYGVKYKLYDLRQCFKKQSELNNVDFGSLPPAYVLVLKGLLKHECRPLRKSLLKDKEKIENKVIKSVKWDKQEYSRYTKGICNLHARYKLCFSNSISNTRQNPDYINGNGTVYKIERYPVLNLVYLKIKDILFNVFNEDVDLHAEGNYYYDLDSTYIGMHRDRERSLTIGCRFGDGFPMYFAWYNGSQQITDIFTISDIKEGDVYIMSKYACGNITSGSISVKHGAGSRKKVIPKKLIK